MTTDHFILNIFPQGGLSSSVVTTVLIGVWVVTFFNLRFGWVLSGLVVPGYLVPLILIKPWAAAVIVLEALVTYLLVWGYSEILMPRLGGTNFFGRDRFFALLLVSVLVRLLFDVLLLPAVGEYCVQTLRLTFDYRNNLHSFGLIVVTLIANQFWKPGLRQGFKVLAVTVGVTYLIVTQVLIPFTNFSIGSIAYMYENLAASMMAGPKAYIVLLTTAFLASFFNRHYGWEYSGILIPALLALEWYQPLKLVATFAETFAILTVAALLLKHPFFKRSSMEGARKIRFFFNIAFLYKFALGYLVLRIAPSQPVSDYYGFGYLISSLLAVKMHDKGIPALITRATLQASFMALVIATVIGFGLTLLPNPLALRAMHPEDGGETVVETVNRPLTDILGEDQILMYRSLRRNSYVAPLPEEADIFSAAMPLLLDYRHSRDEKVLRDAATLLARIGYRLQRIEDKYLYLKDLRPERGWGLYLLSLQPASDLQIEAPAPIDEWGTLLAAAGLFQAVHAKSLAIAGCRLRGNDDYSSDVLNNLQTIFHVFEKGLGRREILQVRGYTAQNLKDIPSRPDGEQQNQQPRTSLWIKNGLPEGLDLARLKSSIGAFDTHWDSLPTANTLRSLARGPFVEIYFDDEARRNLFFLPGLDILSPYLVKENSIVGYLQDWVLQNKERIAVRGSNLYVRPRLEEMLFFDNRIFTPLARISREEYTEGGWSNKGLDELRIIASMVAPFNYQLIRYRHRTSDQEYLILAEQETAGQRRYWGTYVFRLGPANPYLVQVPRPLSEVNVFEFSVALFEKLKAGALLIGGTHPQANLDGSADLVSQANMLNLFNVTSQTILREAGTEPLTVVQCRGFGYRPNLPRPEADILYAAATGLAVPQDDMPRDTTLLSALADYGLSVKSVQGRESEMGYSAAGVPQALYLNETSNKNFVVLWLSSLSRLAFRQQTENTLQRQQFDALQIDTREGDLYEYIRSAPAATAQAQLPTGIDKEVEAYVSGHDIIDLYALRTAHPDLRMLRFIDINTKQAFLLICAENGAPLLVANLYPGRKDSTRPLERAGLTRKLVERFVDERTMWLRLAGDQP